MSSYVLTAFEAAIGSSRTLLATLGWLVYGPDSDSLRQIRPMIKALTAFVNDHPITCAHLGYEPEEFTELLELAVKRIDEYEAFKAQEAHGAQTVRSMPAVTIDAKRDTVRPPAPVKSDLLRKSRPARRASVMLDISAALAAGQRMVSNGSIGLPCHGR